MHAYQRQLQPLMLDKKSATGYSNMRGIASWKGVADLPGYGRRTSLSVEPAVSVTLSKDRPRSRELKGCDEGHSAAGVFIVPLGPVQCARSVQTR